MFEALVSTGYWCNGANWFKWQSCSDDTRCSQIRVTHPVLPLLHPIFHYAGLGLDRQLTDLTLQQWCRRSKTVDVICAGSNVHEVKSQRAAEMWKRIFQTEKVYFRHQKGGGGAIWIRIQNSSNQVEMFWFCGSLQQNTKDEQFTPQVSTWNFNGMKLMNRV